MNVFIRKTCAIFLIAATAASVSVVSAPSLSAQDAASSSPVTTVSLKSPDRKMGLISSLVVQLLAKEHYT